MPRELEMPDFLEESADAIHNRMLREAPQEINLVEGDIFWDATRPAAEEKAELTQMKLQNILRIAFPQTSYAHYLELLGEMKGVFKLSPTKSTGTITVNATEGVVIEKGTVVGTIATDEKPSIEFVTDEIAIVGPDETVDIPSTSVLPGKVGNVSKGTIIVLNKSLNGVYSITNKDEFKNGTEIESEERFRERVLEKYRNEPLSGAPRDYKRWAKEVDGVGNAYVKSEWEGAGTVKVLVLDSNGKPANENLLKRVRTHIIGKETDGKNTSDDGFAPIGAIVTITTPNTVEINISASFQFDGDFKANEVLSNIKKDISDYLQLIDVGGLVNYKAIEGLIGSMIVRKEGIKDYTNLTMNGGRENILLGDEVASMGMVTSV